MKYHYVGVVLSAGAVEDPPPYECPAYDAEQSNGEVPVMLEFWGMWSTPSLPSLPRPLSQSGSTW